MPYVIIDAGAEFAPDENGLPREFDTFEDAEAEAQNIAHNLPGQPVRIYQLMADVMVPVAVQSVTRRFDE